MSAAAAVAATEPRRPLPIRGASLRSGRAQIRSAEMRRRPPPRSCAVGRAATSDVADEADEIDESEKRDRPIGEARPRAVGLLLGERSSHQRPNHLTVGSGTKTAMSLVPSIGYVMQSAAPTSSGRRACSLRTWPILIKRADCRLAFPAAGGVAVEDTTGERERRGRPRLSHPICGAGVAAADRARRLRSLVPGLWPAAWARPDAGWSDAGRRVSLQPTPRTVCTISWVPACSSFCRSRCARLRTVRDGPPACGS